LPNGGNRFVWTYKMAGLKFEGTSEDLVWIENEKIVSHTKGGIESTFTWHFKPDGSRTKLNVRTVLAVPIPLIGKFAESLVARMNEQEIDVMLVYLKAKAEWVSRNKKVPA